MASIKYTTDCIILHGDFICYIKIQFTIVYLQKCVTALSSLTLLRPSNFLSWKGKINAFCFMVAEKVVSDSHD